MTTCTRRNFVAATAIAALGLAGCASSNASGSAAASAQASTSAGMSTIEISSEIEELAVVTNIKDTKTSSIAVALEKGYYEQELLTVSQHPFGGGFPEIMPGLSKGTIDVVPYGSIPTCTYVSQGDDLVIFGGTVLDGSECITLAENKDAYRKAEDFKGKKIACFRMETGHMALKSWLRKSGLTIGALADGNDVEFILLEGYTAIKDPAVAVAFRPNELMGHDFPCCRQTTNRTAFETKKSALVKFEIANLRALRDINEDKEGTIATIMNNSGQPEDYVEATMYSTDTYTAAMKFEMDPMTDDVKAFYEDMVDNGDLENADKSIILQHMDSSIYYNALQTLIERGEDKTFYEGLMTEYKAHNTLGL